MRWSYDTRQDGAPLEFHGDALLTDESIVTGSDLRRADGVGYVYAFERATGKLRWKHRAGHGVMTDIVRVGTNACGVTLGDELICLDLATGRLLWSFASGFANDGFLMNSTPAASADRIFFGGLNGKVYAFEARTGKLLWQRELGARVSTSLALEQDSLYLGTLNRHLYRLHPTTGETLADFVTQAAPSGPLVFAGDSLLLFLNPGGSRDALIALDLSLRRVKWSEKASSEWTSSRPYVWQGTALVGDEEGIVFAYGLADGAPVWSHLFPKRVIRGIGTADDVLYVGTLGGNVFAYRAEAEKKP